MQAPSRAGFCTGNWSSLSFPVQTCIMLWVCSYWKTSVCRQGFRNFLKKIIGPIHFIPGIYPYGVSLLTPIHFRVPSLIFSCDQAALQMVFSVCPSVRLSVCPSVCPSHLFDYVPIIVSSWHFQELLPMTDVRSMQKVKVRGQRSRSQRSRPHLAVSGL